MDYQYANVLKYRVWATCVHIRTGFVLIALLKTQSKGGNAGNTVVF